MGRIAWTTDNTRQVSGPLRTGHLISLDFFFALRTILVVGSSIHKCVLVVFPFSLIVDTDCVA